jgi:hypothetical protein
MHGPSLKRSAGENGVSFALRGGPRVAARVALSILEASFALRRGSARGGRRGDQRGSIFSTCSAASSTGVARHIKSSNMIRDIVFWSMLWSARCGAPVDYPSNVVNGPSLTRTFWPI